MRSIVDARHRLRWLNQRLDSRTMRTMRFSTVGCRAPSVHRSRWSAIVGLPCASSMSPTPTYTRCPVATIYDAANRRVEGCDTNPTR